MEVKIKRKPGRPRKNPLPEEQPVAKTRQSRQTAAQTRTRRPLAERVTAYTVDELSALRAEAVATLEIVRAESRRRRKELKKLDELAPIEADDGAEPDAGTAASTEA